MRWDVNMSDPALPWPECITKAGVLPSLAPAQARQPIICFVNVSGERDSASHGADLDATLRVLSAAPAIPGYQLDHGRLDMKIVVRVLADGCIEPGDVSVEKATHRCTFSRRQST